MICTVELTLSATADLEDLAAWLARNDSPGKAIQVLTRIQGRIQSLTDNPARGTVPPELRTLQIGKYREIFFKPYRIIYHIRDDRVVINLVADGRRDMEALLQRRLTMVPSARR